MPYNPQVQDISGQLLAQGMMQRAQSISGLVGDFMKMEDERQKTTGALKGFLSDPYYQQQVNTNPELAGFAQKVQKGSASLGDVRQFLGTMTAMQSAREQQQKADQMEAQRQYTQALREQALTNAVATEATVAERERLRDEALARARLLKEVFGTEQAQAVSPEDNVFFEGIGGEGAAPVEKKPMSSSERFRSFVSKGGVPDEATIQMFRNLTGEEVAGEKMRSQQEIAAAKAERDLAVQNERNAAKLREIEARAAAEEDKAIRAIKNMRDSGQISSEEANELIRKRLNLLVESKDPMVALTEELRRMATGGGGGGGGGGDGITTRTRTTPPPKAPTSNQYRVISSRPAPGD